MNDEGGGGRAQQHFPLNPPAPPKKHTPAKQKTGNVAANPDEEKFRRINLGNAAFQARVAVVPGAVEFLEACGFARDEAGTALFMPREAADVSALNAAGGEVNNALTNPFFGAL